MSERTLDRDRRSTTATADIAWADHGSCTSADPDLFFPEAGAETGYARSICRACPVRRQCLEYALSSGQKHGIWGGMTESQRRRLRRHTHPSNPVEGDVVTAEPVEAPVRRHLQLVR